jgi:hypothetical protein
VRPTHFSKREWFFLCVLGTGGGGQTLIDRFVAAGVGFSYCGYAFDTRFRVSFILYLPSLWLGRGLAKTNAGIFYRQLFFIFSFAFHDTE